MGQQLIDLGVSANDEKGDDLREGGRKINENTTELYSFASNRTFLQNVPFIDFNNSITEQIANWLNSYNGTSPSSFYDSDPILGSYIIKETDVYFFVTSRYTTQGIEKTLYSFKKGEGFYGINSPNNVSSTDFEFFGRFVLPLNNDNINEVIEVGEIGTTPIEDIVNSLPEFTLDSGTVYIFKGTRNGNANEYYYTGLQGVSVGIGGDYTTVNSDYIDLTTTQPEPSIAEDMMFDKHFTYTFNSASELDLSSTTEPYLIVYLETENKYLFAHNTNKDFTNSVFRTVGDLGNRFDLGGYVIQDSYKMHELINVDSGNVFTNSFQSFNIWFNSENIAYSHHQTLTPSQQEQAQKNIGILRDRYWYEQISMDITQQSTFNNHTSEADIQRLGDDLYRIFRYEEDGNHTGNAGDLYMQKSTDFGKTWESKTVVFSDPTTDNRNSTFGIIGNKFIVFFRKYDAHTPSTVDIGYITSDDFGATWSSFTSVNSDFTVSNLVPFGKIFTAGNKHYASFITTGTCNWLETTDSGATWQFSQEVYQGVSEPNFEPNEVYFEYLGNDRFIGIIRNKKNNETPYYQIQSTDGGVTWSDFNPTNHGVNLKTAPFIFYDSEEDLVFTTATPRNTTGVFGDQIEPPESNTIFLFANRPSEIISNPQNYRLISTQKATWQQTILYGYVSLVKISDSSYIANYTERTYNFKTQKELADLFQFYVNTKLGANTIAPTVKESYRVKSPVGVFESRGYRRFSWNYEVLNAIDSNDVDRWIKAFNHISQKNNPHDVTPQQVGAIPATGGTGTGDYFFKSIINSDHELQVRASGSGVFLRLINELGNQITIRGYMGSIPQIELPNGNSDEWNEAYGWGNHALAGYVKPDGTIPFTAPQQGVDAVNDDEFVTKGQVTVNSDSGWQSVTYTNSNINSTTSTLKYKLKNGKLIFFGTIEVNTGASILGGTELFILDSGFEPDDYRFINSVDNHSFRVSYIGKFLTNTDISDTDETIRIDAEITQNIN